jgi:hypothetical protein
MAEGASYFAGLLDRALGLARDYVGDGVRVSVKTNFGPELPVARAQLSSGGGAGGEGSPGGISGLLGVKAAVIVRNKDGEILATYGEVPKTEPWRALVAILLVAGVGFLIVRGALK